MIGLLCAADGCPVAVEVFEGNTADPATVTAQITKLKQRFRLRHVVMVGDRGMITSARIEQALRPAGLDWITALRGPAIQQLAAPSGPLQLSLFDTRDMAEISSPDYPGERLVVCKNPLLAEERRRKRDELLALTEADLSKIQARVTREKNPLHGAAEIGKAVGAVLGKRKMAKHFELTITDTAFGFTRKAEAIADEARFDGFYVLRTSLPVEMVDAAGTVRAYKSLAQSLKIFRRDLVQGAVSAKNLRLKVRRRSTMASGELAVLFEALPEQATPERVGGGLPRLRYAERSQIEWRPLSLDELVPDSHCVRLVWRFVEGLDLTMLFETIKAVDGRPGHPPADPRILLALWLYATVKGIGSARELARLCEEHVAFRWLCGGVSMNAKTLADFRVNHGAVLERLLVDSFTALVQAGVASLERVAQDGVRVRASAGAASFRRHSTLQDCRREAEQAIQDLRAKLDTDPGSASRRQAAARQRPRRAVAAA